MPSDLYALVMLAVLLTIAPGPDTMLVLRNVMLRGKFAGVATGFGACCGLFIHAFLSALGLSAILLYSATAFTVMKTLGAGYLMYIGIRSLWAAWKGEIEADPLALEGAPLLRGGASHLKKAWAEGFLSNVLNPKVVIVYLAVLPQVIGSPDLVVQHSILFVGIHFVIGMTYLIFLSLFLGKVRHVLLKPAFRRKLESATGALMVAFGLRLALEKAP